jgi:hypothetical protein
MALAGPARSVVIYAAVGLVVGAVAGYLTRPMSAEIRVGPVHIEVTGRGVAQPGDALTSGQTQHIALIMLIGGVIGAGLGYMTERRKG